MPIKAELSHYHDQADSMPAEVKLVIDQVKREVEDHVRKTGRHFSREEKQLLYEQIRTSLSDYHRGEIATWQKWSTELHLDPKLREIRLIVADGISRLSFHKFSIGPNGQSAQRSQSSPPSA